MATSTGINNLISFAFILVILNVILGITFFAAQTPASTFIIDDIAGERSENVFRILLSGSTATQSEKMYTPKSGFDLNNMMKKYNRDKEFSDVGLGDNDDFSLKSPTEESTDFSLLDNILDMGGAILMITGIALFSLVSPIFILLTLGGSMGPLGVLILTLLLLPIQVQAFLLFIRLFVGRNRI